MLWQRVMLAIAVFFFCLVALEIAVRLFTNVIPPVLVRHPVVGKTYRQHFEDDVYIPEAGRKIHLRFNRDGFRGRDIPLEKKPGTRRIAVIEDSYVVAVAVDENKTFVQELERLQNDSDPGVHWQVQNFGVSSSSTGQEIVLFREIVAQYRPDIVICAYATRNDFTDNSSEMSTQSRIRFELDDGGGLVQQPMSTGRQTVTRWLQLHSRLYTWQKEVKARIKHRMMESSRPLSMGSWIYHTGNTALMNRTWELNSRLLQRFKEEVSENGSRFILLVLPTAESVYDDSWENVLGRAGELAAHFDREQPERKLKEISHQHDYPIILTVDEFRRAAAGDSLKETDPSECLFLNGDDHFNDRGHRLIAEILHQRLTGEEGVRSGLKPLDYPHETAHN